MSIASVAAADAWQPLSPERPRPDPEHEARAIAAITRALREIPFYSRRGGAPPAAGASLREVLARLPLLQKKDLRASLPKQWVPAWRDARAALESGALELVEVAGGAGERARVVCDAGWWPRQHARALATHPLLANAMADASRPFHMAVLTTPATGLSTCNVGDLPYEDRLVGGLLHLNQRPDPQFWTPEEQTRMLDELRRHAPFVVESDPFYLAVLARFAAERGRSLDVGGAVLLTRSFETRACRRAIHAAFAGPLLQVHGGRDAGTLFVEGEDGRLHHAPFTTHVELLRARAPTPGASDVALVVATSLDREATPLVRYVTGDLVQVDESLPGRWTSVAPIARVEGRLEDALLRPDGALVTAGALDRALAPVEALRAWQANQHVPGRVEVDVVAPGDGPTVVDDVRARLAPLLGELEIAVRTVTGVPIEASGAFRPSRRHVPLDLARAFEVDR